MEDLHRFLDEIATPYWWVSVIVVGLVLSVGGHFLSKFLENTYANYSKKQKLKIDQKKKEDRERIDNIINELESDQKKLDLFMFYASNSHKRKYALLVIELVILLLILVNLASTDDFTPIFVLGIMLVTIWVSEQKLKDKIKEELYIINKVLDKG